MSMNVLHVARAPVTGVWTVMRNIALWQQQRGIRVGLGLLIPASWPEACLTQLADLERSGIRVYRAWSPNIFGTGAFLWHRYRNPISSWARDFAPDLEGVTVLHFHNAWLSGVYFPVRADGVLSCVTYHGIAAEHALRVQPVRRWLHGTWARRLVHYGADHVSVDGRAPVVAAELFGVDSGQFQVIPNGVGGPPAGPQGCPRLRDPASPFTVGHVGVIDDGKGWRITAEAIASLYEAGRPVRLIIAGSGPQAEDAKQWCQQHEEFAEYLGFVADPMSTVFPRLDAMALPSRREGLPMAMLEAFSQGVPVIATRVGGIPEALTDGLNGFLIERSETEMKDRLLRLLDAPARHGEFSRAARQIYEKRYSQDVMGTAYERVYRDLR